MTKNRQNIIKAINLYRERMGEWPTISSLRYIMDKKKPTLSITIKRMVKAGDVEYHGEWSNGQNRQVKTT